MVTLVCWDMPQHFLGVNISNGFNTSLCFASSHDVSAATPHRCHHDCENSWLSIVLSRGQTPTTRTILFKHPDNCTSRKKRMFVDAFPTHWQQQCTGAKKDVEKRHEKVESRRWSICIRIWYRTEREIIILGRGWSVHYSTSSTYSSNQPIHAINPVPFFFLTSTWTNPAGDTCPASPLSATFYGNVEKITSWKGQASFHPGFTAPVLIRVQPFVEASNISFSGWHPWTMDNDLSDGWDERE